MDSRAAKKIPGPSRDLSWLAFNYRVLQEARDPRVPLLERVKFMAIFSSNLDEFFKVRVATLRRLLKLKKKTRARIAEHVHYSEELNLVMREITRQQKEFGEIFRKELMPELRENGIFLLAETELNDEQKAFALAYFNETLKPLLRPVFLNEGFTHIFLKDQAVFLVAALYEKSTISNAEPEYVLLEVPVKAHGSRFIKLPEQNGNQFIMFIDDAIRLGLHQLFPEYETPDAHAIKISRDADLDINEDVSGNLLAKIERSIRKREKGMPSRLLIDPGMPVALLEMLKQKTGCTPEEVVIGSQYHNFRDLFSLPELNRPDLENVPQPPLPHPAFSAQTPIFETLASQEMLLYYPYQSYEPVIRFFEEAAADPLVSAISCTLYRVASKSKIAKALAKAARNGKFVTVLVELRARFDEESNIAWARKLERAGAFVIYGVPGYKVHCKLALVTRREKNHNAHYAYLSTGNFNENTANVYTDYGFFTTDVRLMKEMDQVFQFFIDHAEPPPFKHLLVAPFNMRKKLSQYIENEIKLARNKKPASMILKLNSLQDERIIEKLYEASQAGVKINLIVRGICTLVAGKKGLSENIKVRSVVDRNLEHTRVYLFGNGGKPKLYISSADWMTRNLSRRVEVAFPVYNPELQKQVRAHLDLLLQDNVKARTPDNKYVTARKGQPERQAQLATYQLLEQSDEQLPDL